MSRASHLKTKYGITEQQYDELLEAQNHCCFVCQRHKDEFKIRLAVDHNHKSGEIRGLLCAYCNHRLVGRHTDPDLVERISVYLRQQTGLFVPPKVPSKRKRRR